MSPFWLLLLGALALWLVNSGALLSLVNILVQPAPGSGSGIPPAPVPAPVGP